MRKSNIFFTSTFFSLLLVLPIVAQDAAIIWPGEKYFEDYSTLDQLKSTFSQDTSAYERRYLIQALPIFVERHNITNAPPAWLIAEISKAITSGDPYLAYEGITTARALKMYTLSDTLVGVYRKARMGFVGEMPLIHISIIDCLTEFNNSQARHALAKIASSPLPLAIAQDIVPAIKAIGSIGDSSCINALSVLSTRFRSWEDSIKTFQQRPNFAFIADSLRAKKLDQIIGAVEKAKNMILARGGTK